MAAGGRVVLRAVALHPEVPFQNGAFKTDSNVKIERGSTTTISVLCNEVKTSTIGVRASNGGRENIRVYKK